MKLFLFISLLFVGMLPANGVELTHRNFTFNTLKKVTWTSTSLPFGFVSEIDVRREINTFSSNSGFAVLNAQATVTSQYDATSNSYEMTHFYTASNERRHLISNFVIPNTNALISLGFDSGSRASKISISKTLFLGLATYKKLDSNSAIYVMAGGWQRERISEQPCLDSYDREYWCPNLTAWSDHKPLTSSPLRFAEVRYELRY